LKKDEGGAVRAQDEHTHGAKDRENMLDSELALAIGRDILEEKRYVLIDSDTKMKQVGVDEDHHYYAEYES
jgi:hypothetical protein